MILPARIVLHRHGHVLIGTLRHAPVHLTAGQVARVIHMARLARAREEVALAKNHRHVTVLRAALRQRCAMTGGGR